MMATFDADRELLREAPEHPFCYRHELVAARDAAETLTTMSRKFDLSPAAREVLAAAAIELERWCGQAEDSGAVADEMSDPALEAEVDAELDAELDHIYGED